MALFLCVWAIEADRPSLLVDDESGEAAREVATLASEGEAPSRVVALPPRLIVLELEKGEDEDGEPMIDVSPLDHLIEPLLALIGGRPVAAVGVCESEAEIGDRVVRCELAAGHEGAIEAAQRSHVGGGCTWEGAT